jgi:hypothetical protein
MFFAAALLPRVAVSHPLAAREANRGSRSGRTRIQGDGIRNALRGANREEFDGLSNAAQSRARQMLDDMYVSEADADNIHFLTDSGRVYFADPIPTLEDVAVPKRHRRHISNTDADRFEPNGESVLPLDERGDTRSMKGRGRQSEVERTSEHQLVQDLPAPPPFLLCLSRSH